MNFSAYFKKRKSVFLLSFFNSIFLLIVTFCWINYSHIVTGEEEVLIKSTTGIKDILFKMNKKPSSDSFLFINLSWEKQLVEVKNNIGQVIGKRAITNRQRIARFLELQSKNPQHKFIILDVWFRDSSDYFSDSLLQEALNKTDRILIPYHKNDSFDFKKDLPIFKAPVALSDYERDDLENNFIKFKLVQGDNFKTTPLVLYESLHNKKYEQNGLFNFINDNISLNSFILNLRIWRRDIEEEQQGDQVKYTLYPKAQLAELLDLPLPDSILIEYISGMTKDRIVVIGDFEDSDIHQTIYGPTPGPLILLNVYLALKEGDSLLNYYWLVLIFVGFFLISYRCFAKSDPIDKYILSRFLPPTPFRTFIMSFVGYMIYFGILSIASYFLFNIHITILFLAIYMEILDLIIETLESRKKTSTTS